MSDRKSTRRDPIARYSRQCGIAVFAFKEAVIIVASPSCLAVSQDPGHLTQSRAPYFRLNGMVPCDTPGLSHNILRSMAKRMGRSPSDHSRYCGRSISFAVACDVALQIVCGAGAIEKELSDRTGIIKCLDVSEISHLIVGQCNKLILCKTRHQYEFDF